MLMRRSPSARLLAGAFLFATAFSARAAERLEIAVSRENRACPDGDVPAGITRRLTPRAPLRNPEKPTPRLPATGCFVIFNATLSEQDLSAASTALASLEGAREVTLEFDGALSTAESGWEERLPVTIKTLSSAIRSGSPRAHVAVLLPTVGGEMAQAFARIVTSEELEPYVDAIVLGPGDRAPEGVQQKIWMLVRPAAGAAVASVVAAFETHPAATLVAVLGDPMAPIPPAEVAALERLAALLTADVSRDPTATRVTGPGGSPIHRLRVFDAKALTPLVLLPQDRETAARIELSGGPFERASVENLASGVRRDFELKGASALTLDLSKGPLAVVLKPMARAGGETRAAVDVGATRGLTAEEIIARERAWDAGQREKVESYTALLDTSLRFRVAEFQGSLDLTIRGPLFGQRGKAADWVWQEFFLNGVKWKGKTIPKLPILQPEKVTTLPLDIRLSEEYDYTLAGETRIEGRPSYRIDFRPRATVGDKPIYRGTAWIDHDTFALLRRESIQLNLKGDTLSNVQTEYYRAVPSKPDVVLPLEIRGQQVFSTAGRVTAVERYVVMTDVQINPSDFATRLAEAYASKLQMVRDTEEGLRYLVPDPSDPNRRVIEKGLTRRSLFGLTGAFYQRSNDYPFPLLGVQYFDFDLWGKQKQLSVFFGGVLLFANYTDPSFLGTRMDLGVDLYGQALPFSDKPYRNGEEVRDETIKHLPGFGQVNLGLPIGPYLKTSLGVFTQWDNFQRDADTGPAFVTPVDTFTNGAELRLSWNQNGYNLVVKGSYAARAKWEPWGDPATSGFDPDQKTSWKYSAALTKSFHFSNFRKLGLSVSYLDGRRLDRFSQWDFGPFSTTRLSGFPSGSVRAERAYASSVSYGINVQNVVRFELSYDQAFVTQKLGGYDNTYFSGIGLQTAMNGPWDNTRIRAEVGYPVVAHGVKGLTLNLQLLKLF